MGLKNARRAKVIAMAMRRLAAALVFSMPCAAVAQTTTAAPATDQSQLLKPEQLDALVSPIALYPDTLLAALSHLIDDVPGELIALPFNDYLEFTRCRAALVTALAKWKGRIEARQRQWVKGSRLNAYAA
jgi:hypothetical protein